MELFRALDFRTILNEERRALRERNLYHDRLGRFAQKTADRQWVAELRAADAQLKGDTVRPQE